MRASSRAVRLSDERLLWFMQHFGRNDRFLRLWQSGMPRGAQTTYLGPNIIRRLSHALCSGCR